MCRLDLKLVLLPPKHLHIKVQREKDINLFAIGINDRSAYRDQVEIGAYILYDKEGLKRYSNTMRELLSNKSRFVGQL